MDAQHFQKLLRNEGNLTRASSFVVHSSFRLAEKMAQSYQRSLASGYLFIYNLTMAVGWSLVLKQLVKGYISSPSLPLAYMTFSPYLRCFQTGAVLEVLHTVFGIVRASTATTAFQVASRIFMLWGVTEAMSSSRVTYGPMIMVVAWALTEIVRYSYFAANTLGRPPYWLVWLRYSTFYLLYPMGAGGEAVTLFTALGEIKETGFASISMPNRWNIAFDYYSFCIVVLCTYPLGLPYMYRHMIRQRRKYLGGNNMGKSLSAEKTTSTTLNSAKKEV